MKNLDTYIEENLETVMEEMEGLISEIIPEVVSSYNWQDEDEEDDGVENSEYDWYDSYKHTTGFQAEYEAAELLLDRHGFDTCEDNQTIVLDRCDIKHY